MVSPNPNSSDHPPAGLPVLSSSASFWHSEPNTFLLNHHTTPDLPNKADIVIIGTGITGASAARYLATDPRATGKSIVLLEAREVCWGATGRNGGHCQPLLFDRTPDIAAFELKNVAAVEEYILEHGIEAETEWRNVQGCRTFWSDALFAAAETEVRKLKEVEPEIGRLVNVIRGDDAEGLRRHRVKVDAGCKGVTLTEGAGCLWPYKYVGHVVEKLVREGKVNLQTNTPVTRIEPARHNGSGSRTLHTPKGALEAKQIILATNGYSSHLLPSFSPLIVPMRCEMSALHPPAGSERLPDSYGFVGCKGQSPNEDDYLVQRPFIEDVNGRRRGGHLMFGGGRGNAMYNCLGEWEDDIVDPGEAEYLRKQLLDTLELGGETEGLKELKASHQWTGIKGFSRDNMPWVGKVPKESGIWMCAGYTGHGMPNASLCAKAVVEMMLADEEGQEYSTSCEKLVAERDLPQAYVMTEERVRQALALPTVAEQDAEGVQGKHSEEMLKEAEQASSVVSKCSIM